MRPPQNALAAACAALVLAACSPAAPPSTPEAVPAAARAAPRAVADEAGLRHAAASALSEQRIYTPAGDNAIEHYLALRRLRADDTTLPTALLELLPYALIAAEQAVAREDYQEARRLLALIERVDPQAPSLARLREGIATAEADAARRLIAEAEATKRREQVATLAEAAQADAARTRQDAVAVATPPVAAPPASAPVAPPVPVRAEPPPVPAAAVVAAPAPKLLSAPPPRYPLVALRRKIEGNVTVAFTIQPDGSVSTPRVVSADPPGLFEEAALVAAARWRFERPPAAVAASRVVQFRLGSSEG